MPVLLVPFIFALLLIAAAIVDFIEQRIPNWIVLTLIALFVVQATRHFNEVSWLMQLGAGAVLLLVGLALFALGHVGAGDAKLMASVSLWAGFSAILPTLFLISVAGLLLVGLLVTARRLLPWARWDPAGKRPSVLVKGGGVPFGVAITTGALLSLSYFPLWLWK